MIRITNLNKYFYRNKYNEIHVINDTTLEFPETGLVTLLGESGSGKTTLLNVIGGLDNFTSGEIDLDGNKIKKYSAKKIDKITDAVPEGKGKKKSGNKNVEETEVQFDKVKIYLAHTYYKHNV